MNEYKKINENEFLGELSEIQFQIVSLLKNREDWMSRKMIKELYDVPRSTLHENLYKLVARGILKCQPQIGKGRGRPQHYFKLSTASERQIWKEEELRKKEEEEQVLREQELREEELKRQKLKEQKGVESALAKTYKVVKTDEIIALPDLSESNVTIVDFRKSETKNGRNLPGR